MTFKLHNENEDFVSIESDKPLTPKEWAEALAKHGITRFWINYTFTSEQLLSFLGITPENKQRWTRVRTYVSKCPNCKYLVHLPILKVQRTYCVPCFKERMLKLVTKRFEDTLRANLAKLQDEVSIDLEIGHTEDGVEILGETAEALRALSKIYTGDGEALLHSSPKPHPSQQTAKDITQARLLGLNRVAKWLGDHGFGGCCWPMGIPDEEAVPTLRGWIERKVYPAGFQLCGKPMIEEQRRRMPVCEAHYGIYMTVRDRLRKRRERE